MTSFGDANGWKLVKPVAGSVGGFTDSMRFSRFPFGVTFNEPFSETFNELETVEFEGCVFLKRVQTLRYWKWNVMVDETGHGPNGMN